ncbi:MAG: hypothetical protein Fur003_1170 [Candidatus Dojkabacteria bacterium]
MLIVMSIFIVLLALGIPAFSGLRASVSLNEVTKKIQQDLRQTQRSALLLDRKSNELWIYGLGIDFSTIHIDGKYKLFKWCSPYPDYDVLPTTGSVTTTIYATSDFPNYSPLELIPDPKIGTSDVARLPLNVNIPASVQDCSYTGNLNRGGYISYISGSDGERSVPLPLLAGLDSSDTLVQPMYVVFEAVSGQTFFYNSSGRLLNYQPSGLPTTNSTNLEINVVVPDKTRGTLIRVTNSSGKIFAYSLNSTLVSELYFYTDAEVENGGGGGSSTNDPNQGSGSTGGTRTR